MLIFFIWWSIRFCVNDESPYALCFTIQLRYSSRDTCIDVEWPEKTVKGQGGLVSNLKNGNWLRILSIFLLIEPIIRNSKSFFLTFCLWSWWWSVILSLLLNSLGWKCFYENGRSDARSEDNENLTYFVTMKKQFLFLSSRNSSSFWLNSISAWEDEISLWAACCKSSWNHISSLWITSNQIVNINSGAKRFES